MLLTSKDMWQSISFLHLWGENIVASFLLICETDVKMTSKWPAVTEDILSASQNAADSDLKKGNTTWLILLLMSQHTFS